MTKLQNLDLINLETSPLPCYPFQVNLKCALYFDHFAFKRNNNVLNYISKTPHRRKSKQLCHNNMIKQYHDRTNKVPPRFFFVICPTREYVSLIWRHNHCRCRPANFDLCTVLMAIEQWGLFSVPHLLCHGGSVYNGHLRGPVTLTPIAERSVVELP